MIAVSTLSTHLDTALQNGYPTATLRAVADFATTDLDAIRAEPALWLHLSKETAAASPMNCGIHQRVEVIFSLIIAAADATTLDTLRAIGQSAFINWQPSGADEPVQYAGGEMGDLRGDLLWWEDRYITAYFIRVF